MDLQVETLDTHEARITITLPDGVVEQVRRDVARKLSKQLRIPGFRPGMAPVAVVVGAVGEQAFANELGDELGSRYYAEAIDEAKVDPYGPGQLEDIKTEPTRLIVRVPLEPKVDLKDYKSVRVPYTAPTVTEGEIESQLQYMRDDNAIVELAERPAQLGDLVEADIEVEAEGKEIVHHHRPVVLDEERLGLAGLAEVIIGMSAGEHKDTTLTLPEDIQDESLRGKEAHVTVDVKRVSNRQLPEINDELAQTVGSFNTLAELREDLRTRLLEYKTRTTEQAYQMQVLDAFTELSGVTYPPVYLEDRLNDMMKEMKEDVRRDEKMPFEDWLKLQAKTEQQVRDEMRPNAETRSKRGLVMREMATAEKVQVTDEEIATQVERTTGQYTGANNAELRRRLMQDENLRTLQSNILSNKVLQRMSSIARGDVADAPADAAPVEPEPASDQAAPAAE